MGSLAIGEYPHVLLKRVRNSTSGYQGLKKYHDNVWQEENPVRLYDKGAG